MEQVQILYRKHWFKLRTSPLSKSHDVLMAIGATQKCERFTEVAVTIAGGKFPT